MLVASSLVACMLLSKQRREEDDNDGKKEASASRFVEEVISITLAMPGVDTRPALSTRSIPSPNTR
jgi:hypothetical protein